MIKSLGETNTVSTTIIMMISLALVGGAVIVVIVIIIIINLIDIIIKFTLRREGIKTCHDIKKQTKETNTNH